MSACHGYPATPNDVDTQHAAKTECKSDIKHKFSRLRLSQLPGTAFTQRAVAFAEGSVPTCSSSRRLSVLCLPHENPSATQKPAAPAVTTRTSSSRRLCVLRLPHPRAQYSSFSIWTPLGLLLFPLRKYIFSVATTFLVAKLDFLWCGFFSCLARVFSRLGRVFSRLGRFLSAASRMHFFCCKGAFLLLQGVFSCCFDFFPLRSGIFC